MNERAEEVLAVLLDRALQGVDSAVEFSKAEIPVVIEQLLMWHMIESLLFTILGILMVVVPLFFTKRYLPRVLEECKKEMFKREEFWVFPVPLIMSISVTFGLLIGSIVIVENMNWLQIMVAPKLYLLEYAAELVK